MSYLRKFVLLAPLAIIVLLLVGITFFILRLWFLGGALFASMIVLNSYTETFPLHIYHRRANGRCFIRILSYNVNRAYSFSENHGTINELTDFITLQDPDVVALQEYNQLLYPELRSRLHEDYPYEIQEGNGCQRFRSVFSKYPISNFKQLQAEEDISKTAINLPICVMTINVDGILIQLVNCHLMSNNFSVFMREYGGDIWKSFMPSLTKLVRLIDNGYAVRRMQAVIATDYLVTSDKNRQIVCGDFNDICGSTTMRSFKRAGLSDAWWKGGLGYGHTYHGMGLRLRLDHILFTRKSMKLINVYVPHSYCSDHDPIVCDFSIV